MQRMGVGLSRSLRRAESGLLFAQEAMPSGLRLETQIQTLEPLAPQDQHDFEAVLNWWRQEGLSIGGGRSRGMGRVTIEWEVDTVDASTESFPTEALVLPSQPRSRLFHLSFTPTTESEEPIRVSAVKLRSYFLGSLGFIPGSTVRGAVGWGLKRGGMADSDISDLLLRRAARFSHLYPKKPLCMPPASTMQCKKDNNHAHYDHLIWQYVLGKAVERDIASQKLRKLHAQTTHCLVPGCEGDLKAVSRFRDQKRRLQIKLALDRTLGRQEAGMFYIYETLTGDQSYTGLIWAEEGLQQVIGEQGRQVFVGGGRGKGFGGGQLRLKECTGDMGEAEAIQLRQEQLQAILAERLSSALDETLPTDRFFFTLTLLTELALPPAVVLANWLRELYSWTLETAYVHWTRLGGYSQTGNRSKPLVQALEQGGALLLSAPADLATTVYDQLAQMECEGLGLLRNQGYGWVYACHPYHYEAAIPVERVLVDG
jgi:hypothetical protein